jgi:hypothetical protein
MSQARGSGRVGIGQARRGAGQSGSPKGSRRPFVSVATFCEKVLTEPDGVVSLIRIVDRVTQQPRPGVADAEFTPFPWEAWAMIILKAGEVRGSHDATFRLTDPDGEPMGELAHIPISFVRPTDGVQVRLEMPLLLSKTGVYWAAVGFDGEELTRFPLEVAFDPTPVQVPAEPDPNQK